VRDPAYQPRPAFAGSLLSPDAVFEVRSPSQSREELREKMRTYFRNGARIGLLVDPRERAVEVYRPGEEPKWHQDPARVPLDPELLGSSWSLGACSRSSLGTGLTSLPTKGQN
jgi:Uma2 family endonuclease